MIWSSSLLCLQHLQLRHEVSSLPALNPAVHRISLFLERLLPGGGLSPMQLHSFFAAVSNGNHLPLLSFQFLLSQMQKEPDPARQQVSLEGWSTSITHPAHLGRFFIFHCTEKATYSHSAAYILPATVTNNMFKQVLSPIQPDFYDLTL